MSTKDLTISYLVDQSPEEVFKAINNVRGWWSEGLEGNSENLGDEFIYRHKDIHYSKQRIIEMIPNKRVVWLVTESHLSFIEDKTEWDGTKVVFDISREGDQTRLHFTHIGLTPEVECFDACTGGWNEYANLSLYKLITTGKGQPDEKSIAKWKNLVTK